MATKKILVSDGSGSTEEMRSAFIGYDDVTNQVSASKITVTNLSSSLQTGVLLANGNFISSSVITPGNISNSGSLLQFSGSAYRLNLPTLIGGDLSGSTTALNNVKVISVANVNSGTLPFARGGTGLSSSMSGVLIKGAGDTLQVLATTDTGSVIGLNQDGWFVDNTDPTTNYVRRVDVITLPSYTWTKKGNPRFLKVTIVGGGGGGGSGWTRPAATIGLAGGGGGGGGGVTEVLLEATNISGGYITTGGGGAGGITPAVNNNPTNGQPGNSGGNTTFSCSLGQFYATGGAGGDLGAATTGGTGGTYGLGNLVINTQSGGSCSATVPAGAGGVGLYSSGGGGGGGRSPTIALDGGASGILRNSQLTASAGIANTSSGGAGVNVNMLFSSCYLNGGTTPYFGPIFGTGGGGGGMSTTPTNSYAGGNAASGSGGGGGGGYSGTGFGTGIAKPNVGGNGGNGFVIIESY